MRNALCTNNMLISPHTPVVAARFMYLGSLVHLKNKVADVEAPVKSSRLRIGLTVRQARLPTCSQVTRALMFHNSQPVPTCASCFRWRVGEREGTSLANGSLPKQALVTGVSK
jgi:hypothetical protein